MCTGSGIPPTMIDRVVGVAKAYTTRVGEGPMPSEDTVVGDLLHGMGREYGATTGRERRCGWFDAVTVRQAVMVNGITDLAVTNFDGLDTLPEVKVCVAYRVGSKRFNLQPTDLDVLARCKPYVKLSPAGRSPDKIRKWKDLPLNARRYGRALAKLTGTRLRFAPARRVHRRSPLMPLGQAHVGRHNTTQRCARRPPGTRGDHHGRQRPGQGRTPQVEGHRRGAESVRSVLRTSAAGRQSLTLSAFSVEN